MALPTPEPGLVISYAYLWRGEHEAGQEEGAKHRPCVIVLAAEKQGESLLVTVAPITHREPAGATIGIAIPPRAKQHLGLDHEKSWVVLSEVNQFAWPGYDLRPIPGSKDTLAYGFLPPNLFNQIKAGILTLILQRRSMITVR